MKHILMVVGSARQASFNKTVAEYIASQLEEKAEVRFLDFKDVPFMNQDIEFPAPAAVVAVREEVKWADAIWIVTPEYNGSFPGYLKNMLDWISRPVEQGQHGAPEFVAGKPVAVSGVGGGPATELTRKALVELTQRMAMKPMESTVGFALPGEAWGTGVLTLGDDHKALLNQQVADFLAFIG